MASPSLRILVFPGSTRSGSINGRLADCIAEAFERKGCKPNRISLSDYPLPIYDGDMEEKDGVPENAVKLASALHEHDAVVIVSPEYNASVSPLLKNAIDWASRVRPDPESGSPVPYRGRIFALASASPGNLGGSRGLLHLRASLVGLGALTLSEQFLLPNAFKAYDEKGKLSDSRSSSLLEAMVDSVIHKASLLGAGTQASGTA